MLREDVIEKNKRTKASGQYFSILIPTWNNVAYLQNCISSIRKNSFYTHQIIVHVNDGSDGTLQWLQDQKDIDYCYSKNNIGICYALNAARELVHTDYIVYMNDDMYACPDWDKYLMDEIKSIGHNNFFLSGTAIEPYPGNNCTVYKNFGTDIASFDETRLLLEYKEGEIQDWQGATWPPNVVHTSVWDLVGGYSVEFSPGFYSDPDFSMKLWHAGIRLFKGLSKSRVYHFGSKSTKRISHHKNYQKFIAKWGITSSTLTKYYLRRGEPFNGLLPEENLSRGIKIKNVVKQFATALKILFV